MTLLTERVTVTLPTEIKTRLQERARQRGISLSVLMREITGEPIVRHDFTQLEQPDAAGR